MVGNGQGLPITGTGNVTIPTTNLKLNDVLMVPAVKKKLLSISQFTRDNNCYFLFYPWGFILKDMKTKQVILKGFMKDRLYPINLQQFSTLSVSFLANKVSTNLWHARLGHPQAIILTKLCLPSMDKQNVFYESCVLGKSTKLPFESRKSYATAFLHTLHSDVWVLHLSLLMMETDLI
jgi:hypothetical protein